MAKSRIPLSSATLLVLLVATSAQVIIDSSRGAGTISGMSEMPLLVHFTRPCIRTPVGTVAFCRLCEGWISEDSVQAWRQIETLQGCLQNAQNVSYKYGFAAQEWIQYPGGLYKASSTANFPASDNLSGALFKLNPGGLREMHWHNPNEWGFVLNGTCRATLVNQGSTHMVESCKVLST